MPLDQLLSQFTGSSSKPSPLAGLFNSPGKTGALSGAAAGAASGAAVSLLMNKKARKKLGKTVAKAGGAAAIAGVGYLAYRSWQNSRAPQAVQAPQGAQAHLMPPPVPANLEMAAAEVSVGEDLPVKLILAMMAAASADGTIDQEEMEILIAAIDAAPVDAAARAQLTAALNQPPTVEEIAEMATGPQEASEIYGAALTAIDVDTPAETLFLRRLASALMLDPTLVKTAHETIAA